MAELLLNPSSYAPHTVRTNKPKPQSLEQRKVLLQGSSKEYRQLVL